ncbi:MAG: ATP-binding protein, partial [Acidobacteriia bacterium]|nr:ATP-binding protein [Terriglobia bacterium]
MSYRCSQLDKDNLGWFPNDPSRATLLAIEVAWGKIRGLQDIKVEFKYPITAIAGKNRSGKTTILA